MIPFLLKDSKIDVAHVVPVTLFQNPADWSVLSTKPQEEPEVANCRLTLVGPGCSENYRSVSEDLEEHNMIYEHKNRRMQSCDQSPPTRPFSSRRMLG